MVSHAVGRVAPAEGQSLRRVKIAGLSTYVPPKVLTNDDLEKLVDTSNEWILQRTGIKERHIVEPGVATSDLAKEAAIGAMRQAGVTPDEIGDPYKLKMEARVNGERRSQGVSEGMLFSFEEIIAHVTKDETLMPGEFIGSGTVGNGCGLELGWYLAAWRQH